ncbi:RNA polymerase sigma factor [Spirosoma soli]|uniref:RNA polymerase sigma factor n=1 Tax=Spirosoma soli TaxID=1770529 RepID=A0ABW5M2J7_9BACT
MRTSLTDEEMIRLYLPTQPTHCFEELYNRYVSKVYKRCLSITHDSEKAEDFTHDIFIKVFAKLDGFQERSSFSTWLYSVSYNYCLDQLRVSKRINTVAIDTQVEDNLQESEEAQLQEETLQLVKLAMKTLSTDETALLKLKYEDGLSVDAIAKLYGVKSSAIKMRLKRTRDKIHQQYKTQYPG